MSTFQFSSDELDQLRALTAPWSKIISRRVFGEEGPSLDVDFRAMEQIATAAAQGLTEGTLELLLRQQAEKLPDQQFGGIVGRRIQRARVKGKMKHWLRPEGA